MRIVLFLPFFLFSFFVNAQTPQTTVDLKNLNTSLLEDLFLKELNTHRASLSLQKLSKDDILLKAANDQASYMKLKDKVGHDQDVKGKENPYNRVVYYNGTNGSVGENCLLIYVGTSSNTNYTKTAVTIITYEETAKSLFLTWKNSPLHYKNMIDSVYRVEGIGFAVDSVTHKLFASQVFGTNPVSVPNEFTIRKDAYGIGVPSEGQCVFPPGCDFITSIFSNYLVIRNDSVYQYYRDLDLVNQIFTSPKDGIAIDIVKRSQFPCWKDNQLHGSPVFDGMMLPPVYASQLIKNNQYAKLKEFYSFVGKLPPFFNSSEYQLNTIIIKNGKVCRYSFPISTVSEQLQLLDLEPEFDMTKGLVKKDSFDLDLEELVPFQRGQTSLDDETLAPLLRKINIYKSYIQDIRIQTYSSIEGTSENNLKLQNKRAEEIRNKLLFCVNGKAVTWNVESKENWEKFYEQIDDGPFAYLSKLDKPVIKEKLKNKSLLDSLEFILRISRAASVMIHVKGKYSDVLSPEITPIAFKKALQNNDPQQAWIIQSQMIYYHKKGDVSLQEMSDFDVPYKKEYLPVYANMIGCHAFNETYIVFPSNGKQVLKVLKDAPDNYFVKYNSCVYALKYWSITSDTLFHPDKLEPFIQSLKNYKHDTIAYNKLLLNYHVMGAYYYYMNHKFDKMDHCLREIWRLYPSSDISEKEAISLAKLFNLYYKFEWSVPLMYPFMKKPGASEEMIFTFVRTAALYRWNLKDEEYFGFLKRAIAMDKDRFCTWIDKSDFQLLRDPWFKKFYCDNCEK